MGKKYGEKMKKCITKKASGVNGSFRPFHTINVVTIERRRRQAKRSFTLFIII
jgi:hypothetical protein